MLWMLQMKASNWRCLRASNWILTEYFQLNASNAFNTKSNWKHLTECLWKGLNSLEVLDWITLITESDHSCLSKHEHSPVLIDKKESENLFVCLLCNLIDRSAWTYPSMPFETLRRHRSLFDFTRSYLISFWLYFLLLFWLYFELLFRFISEFFLLHFDFKFSISLWTLDSTFESFDFGRSCRRRIVSMI